VSVNSKPLWEEHWYRFWKDGQVLERWYFEEDPHDIPPLDAAEGDTFRPGGVGRYSVVGTHLKMEFLGLGESGGSWIVREAEINDDGSFTIKSDSQSQVGGRSSEETYVRRAVPDIKRFPDW
jgi:hypothetical protein